MTNNDVATGESSRATPSGLPRPILGRAVSAVVVAFAASAVSLAVPLLGPLLIALIVGAALANLPATRQYVSGVAPGVDRLLLRAGIVLLGLRISLTDIGDLGAGGVAVITLTVVVTFVVTIKLGSLLRIADDLTVLIASGFSICGAAAIAAVASTRKSRGEDVALAVALVTVFGTVMIGAIPLLGHVLGLGAEQTAMWAGASIHEVAQVVVAASLLSGSAQVLALATAVKLGRVALLAPVQVLAGRVHRREASERGPLIQPFVVFFLLAVTVRTIGVVPNSVLDIAWNLTTLLLAAAMFGLGTGIVARHLLPVPIRVLALAIGSSMTAATVSLLLLLTIT